MDAVDMVLRKYDGRLHRWVTGRRLGADEHGTWIGTPAGTTVHFNYGDRPTNLTQADAVRLVPRDGWWVALFTAEPGEPDVYCDVAAPPTWTSPTEVTIVDLDIDLVRYRADGRVEVEDEDEFALHTVSYGYPPEVVAGATEGASALRRSLIDRTEPFGTAPDHWFALLRA